MRKDEGVNSWLEGRYGVAMGREDGGLLGFGGFVREFFLVVFRQRFSSNTLAWFEAGSGPEDLLRALAAMFSVAVSKECNETNRY